MKPPIDIAIDACSYFLICNAREILGSFDWLLELAQNRRYRFHYTPIVEKEVARPQQRRWLDELIEAKLFAPATPPLLAGKTSEIMLGQNKLDPGEAETLAYAVENKIIILCDESEAFVKIAQKYLPADAIFSTPLLLYQCVQDKIFNLQRAERIVRHWQKCRHTLPEKTLQDWLAARGLE